MSAITTHVLDTSLGRPAAGVPVILEIQSGEGNWRRIGQGTTDSDGRLRSLLPENFPLSPATYRLTFDTQSYFSTRNLQTFYPAVSIQFLVRDPAEHHHVPLLLSPFGYSTYRGS